MDMDKVSREIFKDIFFKDIQQAYINIQLGLTSYKELRELINQYNSLV